MVNFNKRSRLKQFNSILITDTIVCLIKFLNDMASHISGFFSDNFLFDSHAHINSRNFDLDRDQVIERATKNDVKMIFDIGTDISSSQLSLDIAKNNPGVVYSFVGIDPEVLIPGSSLTLTENFDKKWIETKTEYLNAIISSNKDFIKGIGETGMDFYWIKEKLESGEIDKSQFNKIKKDQQKLFEMHLDLAKEHKLPLSIHSRGAEEECLKVIKSYSGVVGIFHSYTGNYDIAKKILSSGNGLGVNGIITFKNAYELRGIYKKILGKKIKDYSPMDFYKAGIFFETDCPFLAPDGKRGERNEPANVRTVFESFVTFLKE